MSGAVELTPELIQATQVKNLLEKLKSGKTLTAWEKGQVDEYVNKIRDNHRSSHPFDQSRIGLAKIWGCTTQYVSALKRKAGGHLPDFASPEDAKKWYDARKVRNKGKRQSTAVGPAIIDFTPPTDDPFESTMLRQAQEMPIHAYALYTAAVRAGDDSLISVRIKNWSEASKQAAQIKTEFIELEQKQRNLISVDECLEIVSGPLQEIIGRVGKIGKRLSLQLCPDNPAHASTILDEDADRTLSLARNILTTMGDRLREPNEQRE